ADLVGIQRSGVSHLISGRNNPSLEVIQKILEAFDYINTDWLITGKGSMIKNEKKEIQGNLFQQTVNYKEDKKPDKIDDKNKPVSDEKSDNNTEKEKIIDSPRDKFPEKEIKKIVIFYSDKTFSEYKPENK
ncbi:MAG: helix-turn-helix transcriptional regulator, partial [Chlorobi bacterium]|nr:helix-turn-helix transcriptional regulator [Chlorobiota bacterium]